MRSSCGTATRWFPSRTPPRFAAGLEREDLFTVVSEQFITDTALYADVVFPAATEIEQLDMIPSWGHLYLGWNEAAIAPRGESVPNTELWRRLARAMGLDDPEFDLDDEALIRSALPSVDVDLLRKQGFMRLDLPDRAPAVRGGRVRDRRREGFAVLAGAGRCRPRSAARLSSRPPRARAASLHETYPLVLLTPKNHTRFLNSSYSKHHGEREGGPVLRDRPGRCRRRGESPKATSCESGTTAAS